MSAPSSSFEMDSLDNKVIPALTDFLLLQDVASADELKKVLISALPSSASFDFLTWGASDEDSPLSTGLLYTTEAAFATINVSDIILTVKNAPTGTSITVDIRKETGVNTNVFATIFSTLPTIDINEFTSQTAAVPFVISDNFWQVERRLQIILTINDSNVAATGLKVSLK